MDHVKLEILAAPTCDNCGVCCLAIGHPHFWRNESDPHWVRLPVELKHELEQYIHALEDVDIGQPCIWYDAQTRRCQHYEYRPQMCRDFTAGSFHCLRMRASHGIESV